MALALALGRRGLGRTWPNPAVGAVVVKDGVDRRPRLDATGRPPPRRNRGAGPRRRSRAIGHALCHARAVLTSGKTPPCADAIIAAGIARVVSALVDPNPMVAGAGHWRLAQEGIVVEVGIGADEARRAHAGHIRRMQDGRPHVMLKLAVSADGKVALSGRRPANITGERARNRVHLMRAMNDAVLTGIGTVLTDDPLLTCRLPGTHSPVRVVLDSKLRLPLACRLVASARQVPLWVIAGEARRVRTRAGAHGERRGGAAGERCGRMHSTSRPR